MPFLCGRKVLKRIELMRSLPLGLRHMLRRKHVERLSDLLGLGQGDPDSPDQRRLYELFSRNLQERREDLHKLPWRLYDLFRRDFF